jgi:hypothetical protein
VTLAAGAATEVHIGTGVGASTLDRVPMILARRTGEAVLFAAVLEPVLRGTKPEVASVHLRPADAGSATGSAWVIEIERSGATDRVAWDGGGDLEVR